MPEYNHFKGRFYSVTESFAKNLLKTIEKNVDLVYTYIIRMCPQG